MINTTSVQFKGTYDKHSNFKMEANKKKDLLTRRQETHGKKVSPLPPLLIPTEGQNCNTVRCPAPLLHPLDVKGGENLFDIAFSEFPSVGGL